MPHFNPDDPLAIPQLYQHQYDVDTLLHALCGNAPQWLNTAQGTLSAAPPQAPASHVFYLEPLPPEFVQYLGQSPELRLLTDAEQAVLRGILPTLTLAKLPGYFTDGTRLGGWLRERVKEAALEWLDAYQLIPPSMRHISRRTAPIGKQPTITIA